jgi:hypothetical protein
MVKTVSETFTESAAKAFAATQAALRKSKVTTDPKQALSDAGTTISKAADTAMQATEGAAAAVGNAAGDAWNAAGNVVSDVADGSQALGRRIGDSAMEFGKNLSPTGVVTGLLGVGLAWMIGSAFGGSFSWVIALMLAPAMFLAGNKFGQDSVEPWISSFADGSSKPSPTVGQHRQREYAAPVVQHRGFVNTRADENFGQYLQNADCMPQQRYSYGNGYQNPGVYIGASFGNGCDSGYGYGGDRYWDSCNSWTSSQGGQWQTCRSNAPRWIGDNHSGPRWEGGTNNNPTWEPSNLPTKPWVSPYNKAPQHNGGSQGNGQGNGHGNGGGRGRH